MSSLRRPVLPQRSLQPTRVSVTRTWIGTFCLRLAATGHITCPGERTTITRHRASRRTPRHNVRRSCHQADRRITHHSMPFPRNCPHRDSRRLNRSRSCRRHHSRVRARTRDRHHAMTRMATISLPRAATLDRRQSVSRAYSRHSALRLTCSLAVRIIRLLGQGTFGKVVEATEKNKPAHKVAVKIIRAVPKYREAAGIEIRVLRTLRDNDPENKQ